MPVYLDHAATTWVRPEVTDLLIEQMASAGNPSSVHAYGQAAKMRLEAARVRIAKALGCDHNEVVFTSGGTESNNLAILGLYEARNRRGQRPLIYFLGTEHHAVLEPIEHLEKFAGAEAREIPVDSAGHPDLDWLEADLLANADSAALVTAIYANNETGTIVNLPDIVALCKRLQIPVHTDAVAAVGHIDVNFRDLGASTLAFTGHKLGAPIGVGVLLVGRDVHLCAQQFGGTQERAMRAGTQNVAGAEAVALAVELAVGELAAHRITWEKLRDQLIDSAKRVAPDLVIGGDSSDDSSKRLSNIVNLVFPGCAGDSLLFLLDSAGVAISNGSACTAGVATASHVLLAQGFSQRDAGSCVRVSFGATTTSQDLDALLSALPEAYSKAKAAGFTV
ncbi:MAG: cysteine desulfurase [Actinomycetales bacterium]|nr:cysteine desulfurase [Actinomycetales bacterium]